MSSLGDAVRTYSNRLSREKRGEEAAALRIVAGEVDKVESLQETNQRLLAWIEGIERVADEAVENNGRRVTFRAIEVRNSARKILGRKTR